MPLNTMYHPYAHSPSALTEYLRQKLGYQCAKQLSHSLSVQVKQNAPLKCNTQQAKADQSLWKAHGQKPSHCESAEASRRLMLVPSLSTRNAEAVCQGLSQSHVARQTSMTLADGSPKK